MRKRGDGCEDVARALWVEMVDFVRSTLFTEAGLESWETLSDKGEPCDITASSGTAR